MEASRSYPSRVLAGLMAEAEFFSFLAIYAVPEDRANPVAAMRERWAASAAAFAAQPPCEPAPLEPWEPALWGEPAALAGRPGVQALLRQHPDAAFGAAPLGHLVVHHPSLDLDQADYWAARLGDPANLAAPSRNDAPAGWEVADDAQSVAIRSGYALLGAYLTAEGAAGSPLPHVAVHWQPGINVVQVGKLGERLILVNGHHRAYALARAGARQVPCISYEIPDLSVVEVSAGSRTDAALRAASPPLLRHFLDPTLAVLVQLRRSTRVVTLAVAQDTIQER